MSSAIFDDAGGGLPPLEKLTVLELGWASITDESLLVLHKFKNLERLELAGCRRITSISHDWAAKFERLKELNLNWIQLDSSKIEGLSSLPDLQVLSLMQSNIALEDLPFLPTLRVVRIDSKKQPVSTLFPYPTLPEGLRLETSDGLFSDDERDLLYKHYPNLTIVELEPSTGKDKNEEEWSPILKSWDR
ncbi:MAG: hypothetical protein Q8M16_13905 [Pirellulaceae bacterium]|nr:hypothetical protein [Pirellulaceae bacterium]